MRVIYRFITIIMIRTQMCISEFELIESHRYGPLVSLGSELHAIFLLRLWDMLTQFLWGVAFTIVYQCRKARRRFFLYLGYLRPLVLLWVYCLKLATWSCIKVENGGDKSRWSHTCLDCIQSCYLGGCVTAYRCSHNLSFVLMLVLACSVHRVMVLRLLLSLLWQWFQISQRS